MTTADEESLKYSYGFQYVVVERWCIVDDFVSNSWKKTNSRSLLRMWQLSSAAKVQRLLF